ncbi:MAG: sulfite exporter TauE/SafE family protein [Limnohabitans sp.]|jgi:uncharacterized membrane protein YfcA|nr:sulfite exporter TauE/SafE family protein [Limnohabitans sp.]
MELLLVTLASALAGFVDSIVGGGGLILTPMLFAVYPQAVPATLFGTNKSASVWGTLFASWQYSRRVELNWAILRPAIACTVVGSFVGAWALTLLDGAALRLVLPFVLGVLLAYTLARKELGQNHAPRFAGRLELGVACLIGSGIGFYDGFFGPGTGSFFVFLLVRVMGYDFLNASASAKLLNLSSNFAALVLFALKGHVWWHMALPLALANIVGSLLGTRLALRHGASFVRLVFIGVVTALIGKTGYDAWMIWQTLG